MNRLSLALLHYPVVDKHDEIYTTAITNIDVHDIARSAKTYGLAQYYLVSPITAQQELGKTIASFWIDGAGMSRNPDRSQAMELVSVQADLDGCIANEHALTHSEPVLIATSAKSSKKTTITYDDARGIIEDNLSTILLFGTGHGLAPSVIEKSHYLLEPIYGVAGYNHLSVRSAAAVILDRLTVDRA